MANSNSANIKEHFKLAIEFLNTAKLLRKEGYLRSAVDRAYYGMYHAAIAALLNKGIVTKTHKGLHQQFNKEYIKSGLLDAEMGKFLQRAYILRQQSDYEIASSLDDNQAEELVDKAEEFITKLQETLGIK